MSENVAVANKAANPKTGMTIGEIYAFTQDALRHGIDPRTPATAVIGWRQQIQAIGTRQGGNK